MYPLRVEEQCGATWVVWACAHGIRSKHINQLKLSAVHLALNSSSWVSGFATCWYAQTLLQGTVV